MSRASHNLIFLLAVLVGLASPAIAAPTPIGSITISGTEQSSAGVWDQGTVTATLNGVSVAFHYGQFSTPAGIASGLAAMISQNCNMPVYAQSTGTTINFYARGSNVLSSASISSASGNPTLFASNSFLVDGGAAVTSPTITSLSFPSGPATMGLTIYGTNFGLVPGTVLVAGSNATVLSWSPATITVQVPAGAGPPVVKVTANGGLPSNTWPFTIVPPFGCN